jgi:hypothetical protein
MRFLRFLCFFVANPRNKSDVAKGQRGGGGGVLEDIVVIDHAEKPTEN